MSKIKTIQVGVGGYGGARRIKMRASDKFDLIACFDINEQAMKDCRQVDGAVPADSFQELLETPEAEALIISTGAKFHAEQTIAALNKGLHVFVEKPLCSTPQEIVAINEAQKKSGKVVCLGHIDHQNHPKDIALKEMVDSGELGTITHVEKATGHRGGFCIKPGDWRGDPLKNPGGMLFQCGVHGFHCLHFLFGPIRKVMCTMRYDINKNTQTADVAMCLLEFESGLIGSLNAFHVCPYRHYMNIYGTKGNVYREDLYFDEGIKCYRQNFTTDGSKEPHVSIDLPSDEGFDNSSGMVSFYNAIRSGADVYPSLKDGAMAVAVVFAAEESSKIRKPVEIEYR